MSGCNTRFPSKINELDNIKNRCINLESDKDIIGKEIFKTESIAFTKNIAQKSFRKD